MSSAVNISDLCYSMMSGFELTSAVCNGVCLVCSLLFKYGLISVSYGEYFFARPRSVFCILYCLEHMSEDY